MSNQRPTNEAKSLAGRMRLAMGRQVSTAIQLLDQGVKLEKVDDLTQRLRITICEGCPRFDPDTRQCLECTCPMDYKTSLAHNPWLLAAGVTDPEKTNNSCPLHKW